MSTEVNIDVTCTEFTAKPNYHRGIDLSIENVDLDDIIEAVGVQAILDKIDSEIILDHIGLQAAKDYFDLVEIELVTDSTNDA